MLITTGGGGALIAVRRQGQQNATFLHTIRKYQPQLDTAIHSRQIDV
jgi:hypothetical protein